MFIIGCPSNKATATIQHIQATWTHFQEVKVLLSHRAQAEIAVVLCSQPGKQLDNTVLVFPHNTHMALYQT